MAFFHPLFLALIAQLYLGGFADAHPQLGHDIASANSEHHRRQDQAIENVPAARTSFWPISEVSTAYDFAWVASETKITYLTTGTATQIQPSATALPAVVSKTIISHMMITKWATGWDNEVFAPTTYSKDRTTTITLHLYQPQPTDLPDGTKVWDVPCEPCLSPEYKPDPQCEALGFLTACQSQCHQADGVWECRERWADESRMGPDYVMGRACWRPNSTDYKPLWTPCVAGDHQIGCTPCEGNLGNYLPQKWVS